MDIHSDDEDSETQELPELEVVQVQAEVHEMPRLPAPIQRYIFELAADPLVWTDYVGTPEYNGPHFRCDGPGYLLPLWRRQHPRIYRR